MRMLLAASLVALVAACTQAPAASVKTPAQDRHEAAELALSKTPAPRIFEIGEHQLLVFNVPVKTIGGMVDYQRCMVWRDREFKSATLQCPSDVLDTSPDVGPESEARYRP